MIDIQVEGKSIVLYKDTSFQMELNNSIFYTDNIEGDVVYNFDIPVAGNERVFGLNHLPYSASNETYDCIVIVDGVQLIHGSMIVQKSTRLSYSVAISVNPFPEGWADASVRENEDSEIVVVNDQIYGNGHNSDWKSYLYDTFSQNSFIKFGLCRNEKGYGGKNDDFGTGNDNLINTVFLINGSVSESIGNGISLFNTSKNRYCLCPQIRLSDIIRRVMLSSGYGLASRLDSNQNMYNIFVQSPIALDADKYQYMNFESLSIHVCTYYVANFNGVLFPTVTDLMNDRTFFDAEDYTSSKMFLDGSFASQGNFAEIGPNSYGLLFNTSGYYKFTWSIIKPLCDAAFDVYFFISEDNQDNSVAGAIASSVYYTSYSPDMNYNIISGSCILHCYENHTYYIRIARLFSSTAGLVYRTILLESNISVESVSSDISGHVNVYKKSFTPMQCLPNISNSDFISRIRKSLGITFYFDYQSKMCEIGIVSDIEKSKCIDFTDYMIDNDVCIEHEENQGYSLVFNNGSNESYDIPSDRIIQGVNYTYELPLEEGNLGKYCFVKSLNSYFKSDFVGVSGNESIVFVQWVQHASASEPITVGYGGNDINGTAIIPCMKEVGLSIISGGVRVILPNIISEIESPFFGTDTSEDLILLFDRGRKTLNVGSSQFEYEDMSPVSGDGSFQLNTVGENSLGELHLRKWLEILSKSDTITYKLLLPIGKMIELFNLLRPQDATPDNQTRFIMINSVKLIPKKITAEINNSSGRYLCEVQCVKAN